MLNDFTINYRGVEITPQLEHQPMRDILHYEYCEYNVCVAFDAVMYHEMKFKDDYIENLKRVAIDGLNELRARDINKWYDNMEV